MRNSVDRIVAACCRRSVHRSIGKCATAPPPPLAVPTPALRVDSDGDRRQPSGRRRVEARRQVLRHRRMAADPVHDHVGQGRRVRRRALGRRARSSSARPNCRTPTRSRSAKGRPYNLYHGTLEARPVTATTSKIVYTLFFDNSMLADDAARERNMAQRNDDSSRRRSRT